MNNTLKKFKLFFIYVFNYILSVSIFVFVMLNAVQLFFVMDIPFAYSLERFNHNVIINDLITDFKNVEEGEISFSGQQYVQPEFMKVYRNDIEMPIDKEYIIKNERWVRPTSVHYTTLNYDKEGNPGDTLLYMNSSWRSVPDPSIFTTGTNILVESINAGGIEYRVIENFTLNQNDRYVPTSSSTRQLIILINNKNGTYSIIRAIS